MRIHRFRAFFANSYGYARRAGMAIASKVRDVVAKIELSVGVGDDESSFGGNRSRVWIEFVEKTKERLLEIFEKSYFERFPRLEKLVRKFLAKPMRDAPLPAPAQEAKAAPRMLGAHNLQGRRSLNKDVQEQRMALHLREGAGLLDRHRQQKQQKKPEEPGVLDDHS